MIAVLHYYSACRAGLPGMAVPTLDAELWRPMLLCF